MSQQWLPSPRPLGKDDDGSSDDDDIHHTAIDGDDDDYDGDDDDYDDDDDDYDGDDNDPQHYPLAMAWLAQTSELLRILGTDDTQGALPVPISDFCTAYCAYCTYCVYWELYIIVYFTF